jgi:hypothetical protein
MSAAVLSLANACTIVDRALEVGRLNKLQPLTVVVLDAGGKLPRRVGRSPLECAVAENRPPARARAGCAEASGSAPC